MAEDLVQIGFVIAGAVVACAGFWIGLFLAEKFPKKKKEKEEQ